MKKLQGMSTTHIPHFVSRFKWAERKILRNDTSHLSAVESVVRQT